MRVYGQLLEQAGFTVFPLTDERQIATLLAEQEIDVVITDLAMPVLNGLDVLRAVRLTHPDLPVVLMTGVADMATAIEAVELGALRYLIKPVPSAVLIGVTEGAVDTCRRARSSRRAVEHYREVERDEFRRAGLARAFDRALSTLFMVYQPVVRWSDRSVFAYEAFVATEEPALARPVDLFAAAETLNRMSDVGRAVRRSVARTLQSSVPPVRVFVNLHPRDFDDEELYSTACPLSSLADHVVLEVTERASLDATPDLPRRLAALRGLGYRLALDDLGAGYAGLTAITEVHPEIVKIDMSLVRGIAEDATKRRLVETLAAACRDLRMLLIAEGVERPDERDALIGLGCDLFQGYLFARPALAFSEAAAVTWSPDRSVA